MSFKLWRLSAEMIFWGTGIFGGTLGWVPAVQAQQSYHVTANTSSLSGTAGFLDFQFAKGNAFDALDATAVLSNVLTDGTLDTASTVSGDASGILPGTVAIKNTGNFNDLYQGFTFGTSFSFDLIFSGAALNPALPSSYGSTFAFSLFASDGTTPLLTTDPNGTALTVNLNPGSVFTTVLFPASNSEGPAVTLVNTSPVPELTTSLSLGVLLALGMGGLHRTRCRKKNPHD